MTNPKPPIFPHPNTFTNHEGVQCSFTYEGEMAGRALLFKGKTDEGKPICIKFVRTYGKEVHLWFAAKGFAPPLIAYEKLPGGWYMVVMGLLDDSWVPFDIKTSHDFRPLSQNSTKKTRSMGIFGRQTSW
jgi:hypothetical protein